MPSDDMPSPHQAVSGSRWVRTVQYFSWCSSLQGFDIVGCAVKMASGLEKLAPKVSLPENDTICEKAEETRQLISCNQLLEAALRHGITSHNSQLGKSRKNEVSGSCFMVEQH